MLRRVHGTEIELDVDDAPEADDRLRVDGTRDLAILRIANEALHNALRHAGAGHVAVRLADGGGTLVLEVRDDGVGFEPGRAELRSRHLGLTSMEERARELGGQLQISSAPGAGTMVRLELAG